MIYVACDGGEQAAAGWRDGRLELGPLRSRCDLPRRLLPRRETGAIDSALSWLGVRAPRPALRRSASPSGALGAGPYLSSRESRRSLSTRSSVWQCGQ